MGHINLIFNVHIPGAYLHICTKKEVSMCKPVAGRAVQRGCDNDNDPSLMA